eukprot:512604_1
MSTRGDSCQCDFDTLTFQCRSCQMRDEEQAIMKAVHDVLMQAELSYDETIYITISTIIALFSTGFIFNCCNSSVFNCHKDENIEISINRYDFDRNIDDNGDEIYYYYPTQHNQLYSIPYKNNKKIRIFCSSCTKNELHQCQYRESKRQPCWIKDNEFIVCNINKHKTILACHNHERCNFCNKLTETDLFTDQISNCRTCSNRMHRKCSNRGICSICCANSERQNLFIPINEALQDILYMNLINFIVDYVMGFTVSCANCFHDTQTVIHFQSEWQFKKKMDENGANIQYYQLTKYNKLPSNIVYDKKIRAFCNKCVSVLVKCVRCNTMDNHEKQNVGMRFAGNICHNHEKCVVCDGAVRYQSHCEKCNRAMCKECKQLNMKNCKGCFEEEQNEMKYRLRNIINCVLIINNDILNIIVDYAIGYVFYCCNEKIDCKNDIVCDSIQWMQLYRTTPKSKLIYYDIRDGITWVSLSYVIKEKIRLQTTPNSVEIRIFCKDCANMLNQCLWENCDNYDSRSVCIGHSNCWECNGQDVKNCSRCKSFIEHK